MRFFHSKKTKKKEEGVFVEDRLKLKTAQKRTVLMLAYSIAMLGWAYVLFFSDIFTVHHIQIEGIEELDKREVEDLARESLDIYRIWPFRAGNLFVLNLNQIQKDLSEKVFAESVIVDKIYPNILRLKIEERQSSLILVLEDTFYEIDRFGVLTKELESDEEIQQLRDQYEISSVLRENYPPILRVVDQSMRPIIGDEFVSEYRMEGWLDTFQTLKKAGFGYREAVLESPTSTKLILDMFEPYQVYLDVSGFSEQLTGSLKAQIESYYTFMKVHEDSDIREYIDARIPGKVFYK